MPCLVLNHILPSLSSIIEEIHATVVATQAITVQVHLDRVEVDTAVAVDQVEVDMAVVADQVEVDTVVVADQAEADTQEMDIAQKDMVEAEILEAEAFKKGKVLTLMRKCSLKRQLKIILRKNTSQVLGLVN